MFARAALLAALALAGVAGDAAAQHRRGIREVERGDRHGFWIGLGAGVGGESFRFDGDPDYSGTLEKPVLALRLGGTPSRHFRVGGEISAWLNENGDALESLTSFLLIGQFYPLAEHGLYVKGGLGLGRNALDLRGGYELADVGFATAVGAGWEVRLGRNVFLVPAVELVTHRYEQRDQPDYRERIVHVGVGLTFQSGR